MYKFFGNIRLAIKSIFGKKIRSFLTMLGIIIGVFSIVSLIGIGQGVKSEVVGQIEGFGSNMLMIMPGSLSGGPSSRGTMSMEDVKTINDVDGLDYVVPVSVVPLPVSETEPIAPSQMDQGQIEMMKEASTESSDSMMGAGSMGVLAVGSTSNLKKVLLNSDTLAEGEIVGRIFNDEEYESAAKVTTLMSGAVTELFPDTPIQDIVGKTIYVGKEPFEIIGAQEPVESTSMFDDQGMTNVAIIPLKTASELAESTNITQVVASVSDVEEVDTIKENVRLALLEAHEGIEDFSITTQEEVLSMLDQILSVITAMLGGIAAISLLVGGIGVMNIMLVSVTERTFEIGLRKAIGASNSDILIQFLVEAIFLTFLGGTIGIVFAYLGAFVMDAQFGLAPVINLQSLALAYSFTATIGIIFGVAPAIRASRLDPINALRHE